MTTEIHRPNILIITVDEMRYPPKYEDEKLRKWSVENLEFQTMMRKNGFEFHQHHTSATACVPSRTTRETGQYPTLHGCTQTDGAAKGPYDSDMFWLDANTVPSTANFFKANGYKVNYKGKWNISAPDILLPGTKNSFISYDSATGEPLPKPTEVYLEGNRLGDFGYDEWVGPEPNGNNGRDSGASAAKGLAGRDQVYADEVVDILRELASHKDKSQDENKSSSSSKDKNGKEASENNKPFLIVASFVNPHDITLFGEVTRRMTSEYNFEINPSVPSIPPAPTANEDLKTKPDSQRSYKKRYQQGFQPTIDDEYYRRLYYSLNETVDKQMKKVLDALYASPFKDNTIVVFNSDHGSNVGAHGLFQKFYTAYEESIHVPFIISLPKGFRNSLGQKPTTRKGTNKLTTHVDLLPTLLSLANIDVKETQKKLKESHCEVRHLVGQDLSPLLFSKSTNDEKYTVKPEAILFVTNDNVFTGQNQFTITGKPYRSVIQPSSIQTIITRRNFSSKKDEKKEKDEKQIWKYSRYYDDPQFWTSPNKQNVETISTPLPSTSDNKSSSSAVSSSVLTTITKTEPVPDQFEMYNLTIDPFEEGNLANPKWSTPETRKIQKKLAKLLDEQCNEKLLTPSSTGKKSGSLSNFPRLA
jgi:arylsulfatase A-like enzyme